MRKMVWVVMGAVFGLAQPTSAQPPLDVVDPWKRDEARPALDPQDPWNRDTASPSLDTLDPWDDHAQGLGEIRDPWRDRSKELGQAASVEDPWAQNVPTAAFPPTPQGAAGVAMQAPASLPKLAPPRGPVPTAAFPLL